VLADVLASHPHFDEEELVQLAIAERVYIERLTDFLRQQGIVDEELIAAAQESYRRDWFEHMVLYEDAVHTLEALRPRFKLGLITNGPVWTQRPKIERFRLVEYLDLLIVSEEVGVAKPDPAIFQIALERLGVQPSEALFVGDSPEHDLRGAAAAGMPCVWMNPHGEQLPDGLPPPLATITCLAELLPVLKGG
jgi:HAD superfamily hydrolase (TIGR01549 family)